MARLTLLASLVAGLALTAAATGTGAGGGTIVYSADRAPALAGEIYRLDAGGTLVDLSRSPFDDERPLVSPAGGHVAFLRTVEPANRSAVFTAPLAGGAPRAVLPSYDPASTTMVDAWSPDGSTLAVALSSSQLVRMSLAFVRGTIVSSVRLADTATSIDWTPNGHYVTFVDGVVLQAVDPVSHRLAWSAPLRRAVTGWSPQGLFAGDTDSGVAVYNELGRRLFGFPGADAAWSPDGTLLASIRGGTLEIRDIDGRVLHRLAVAHLQPVPGELAWTGARSIEAGAVRVDARTGRAVARSSYPVALSRTGGYLASVTRGGASFSVQVSSLDGLHARVLERAQPCGSDGDSSVSGAQPTADGRSVVFASACDDPFAHLYAVSPSGGESTELTHAASQTLPSFSPDGTKIAYAQTDASGLACKGCAQSLWIARADGSQPLQLTRPDGQDGPASFSPDGTRLVFSRSSASTQPDLFTVPASGGPLHDLHLAGSAPAWGPQSIAYADGATDPTSVWTVAPDGAGARRVGVQGGSIVAPAWSKDGRLAWVDGTRLAVLTGTVTSSVALPFQSIDSVAWSPDGTQLAVVAWAKGQAAPDVYVLAANGTSIRRVTKDADASSVAWGLSN